MSPASPMVWLDGRLQPEAEARIAPRDRGFLLGDGLFETLRCEAGAPLFLDAHLARLAQGGEATGIAVPDPAQLAAAVKATLHANDLHDAPAARVRITMSRGTVEGVWPADLGADAEPATVLVTAMPAPPLPPGLREGGAAVVVAKGVRVLAGAPTWKSTSYQPYLLARREAAQAGAWEALLCNHRGEVAEGAASNVFAVIQGALTSPPLDAGILPGVTRATVLALARRAGLAVEEAPITPAALAGAEEAFLTGSLAGLVPVASLDGRRLDADKGTGAPRAGPGPVTQRLIAAYADEVAAEVKRGHAAGWGAGSGKPPRNETAK